jgi:hypothetical protein
MASSVVATVGGRFFDGGGSELLPGFPAAPAAEDGLSTERFTVAAVRTTPDDDLFLLFLVWLSSTSYTYV